MRGVFLIYRFMKNNILFIGGTHGDEPIGVRVLQELEKIRNDFDWIIGNVPALKHGTREYEGNLNRSAPGDINAKNYASRRTAEILALSTSYQYTIDLHGTSQPTGLFIIITNPTKENFELAQKLDVKRVVVWPSFSSELKGPLSEFFPCGLEIECGPKEAIETQQELERVLIKFLDAQEADPLRLPLCKGERTQQDVFEVYGSWNGDSDGMQEFIETTKNNETFFPLLIGAYKNMNGITCYKMRCKIPPPCQGGG